MVFILCRKRFGLFVFGEPGAPPRRGAAPSGLPVGSGLNAGEGEFEVGMEWVGSDDPERDAKGAGG